MIRYRQHFLLAALFALIVFGALTNSHQVSAQQQGPTDGLAVRIVNQPVAVTGSTSVSGNVTATEGGSWNVGITGTPTVLTHNLEEPGIVPYQQEMEVYSVTCDQSNTLCSLNLTFAKVPANKRLVIKQISVLFEVAAGAPFVRTTLAGGGTNVLGTSGLFPTTETHIPITREPGTVALPGSLCSPASPCEDWVLNQQINYYVEPNSAPLVILGIDKNHLVGIFPEVTLDGYYVPIS